MLDSMSAAVTFFNMMAGIKYPDSLFLRGMINAKQNMDTVKTCGGCLGFTLLRRLIHEKVTKEGLEKEIYTL